MDEEEDEEESEQIVQQVLDEIGINFDQSVRQSSKVFSSMTDPDDIFEL
jgi:hypothetical protein